MGWLNAEGHHVCDPELPCATHTHVFKGGLPSRRLRRMMISHEGRARRAGLPWAMIDLRDVYKRYEGCCGICRQPIDLEAMTIDHIKPLSAGGGHTPDNVQPAHQACNSRKGNRY